MSYEYLQGMGASNPSSAMALLTDPSLMPPAGALILPRKGAEPVEISREVAKKATKTFVENLPGTPKHLEKFKVMSLEDQAKELAKIYAYHPKVDVGPYEAASPEAASIAFEKLPGILFQSLKYTIDRHPQFILSQESKEVKRYDDQFNLLPIEKKAELLSYAREQGKTEIFDHFAQVDPAAAAMVAPSGQSTEGQELLTTPEEQPGMPIWGWVAIGVGGVALLSLLGWVSFRK